MRYSSRLALPMRRPEDVIPHLGAPLHWGQGQSAKALAESWFRAGDVPPAVRRVLNTHSYLADAEFLDGWLERETDLRDGPSMPSRTGLLALMGLERELLVLGVVAKVDEGFGPLVSKWIADGRPGKARRLERLERLCRVLRLDPASVGHLRYELLHRAVVVMLEAQRFRTTSAAMVIHSFCGRSTGLTDCVTFFDAIGMGGFGGGTMVGARKFGVDDVIGSTKSAGICLWAGWASDVPLLDKAGLNEQMEVTA